MLLPGNVGAGISRVPRGASSRVDRRDDLDDIAIDEPANLRFSAKILIFRPGRFFRYRNHLRHLGDRSRRRSSSARKAAASPAAIRSAATASASAVCSRQEYFAKS